MADEVGLGALFQVGRREPGHDAVGMADFPFLPLAWQLSKKAFEGAGIGFETVELESKGNIGDALVGF